jgi:hypothetical protein
MSKAKDLAILIRHLSYNDSTDQVESSKPQQTKGKKRGSQTKTSTDQFALDTFAKADFKVGKYIIGMSKGSDYHSIEIHLIHDGSSSVDMTQYGEIKSDSLATFDADISGADVRLLCTPASATSTKIEFDVTLVDA